MTATFASLPTPITVAHRGGAITMPDQATETFAAGVARVGHVVEADVHKIADGTTVCMHDNTVDRTTTGSGDTAALTLAGRMRLRVDAGTWFGSRWPSDLHVPSFDEFLDITGDHRPICPEAKNAGSGQLVTDAVVARGLEASTMVQSFLLDELVAPMASGIDVGVLHSTGVGLDFDAIAATGVEWALLKHTAAPSRFTDAIAAGLRVGAWTVNTRGVRDELEALGVELFFSDDPWYLIGNHRVDTDPFGAQTYWDGYRQSAGTSGTRNARWFAPDEFGWDNNSGSYGSTQAVRQGWGCPIGDDADADAFTIDFDLRLTDSVSGTRWAGIFICDDSDAIDFVDNSTGNGYHILFRRSGDVSIYRITDGAAVSISSTSYAGMSLWSKIGLRVTVTPTQVKVTRTDIAATELVVSDTAHRGGYFWFTANSADPRFSNVKIS